MFRAWNDFRLVIKGDEMQRYAEQLILFSKSNTAGKEKDLPREGKERETVPSPSAYVLTEFSVAGLLTVVASRC